MREWFQKQRGGVGSGILRHPTLRPSRFGESIEVVVVGRLGRPIPREGLRHAPAHSKGGEGAIALIVCLGAEASGVRCSPKANRRIDGVDLASPSFREPLRTCVADETDPSFRGSKPKARRGVWLCSLCWALVVVVVGIVGGSRGSW